MSARRHHAIRPLIVPEEACAAMNGIQKAGERLRAEAIKLIGWLISVAFGLGLLLGGLFLIGYMMHGDAYWYSITAGAPIDKVTIEKKPHDCEFSAAPLGEKNCHYEKIVDKVMWATSTTGQPIVSDDDGKTWTVATWANDPGTPKFPQYPTTRSVYISWKKGQD
jgi:hypothetical protein